METILVVDDEPAIREIFSAYLGMKSFNSLTASGGMECLDLLKTQKPDLILLDMMMEPTDGWQTLLAIRANPASCHIPVIIITGKQPVPEEILQYGGLIEDFIVKPVEFHKFVTTLPRIIGEDKALARLTAEKRAEMQDPVLVDEYIRVLRLVRITHHLMKRFGDIPWADRINLQKQEELLAWLQVRLGIPDHYPGADEAGAGSPMRNAAGEPEWLKDNQKNDYTRGA
jgi:two-component system OmpR family response regulator